MGRNIRIVNAHANNLKNVFAELPLGQVIGVSGVSGSGKSTLIKDIVAAYGIEMYSLSLPMFTRGLISNKRVIPVDNIDNLPATVMIDVINSISTPSSTLSTVTGIHTLFRELYASFGIYKCNACGADVDSDVFNIVSNITIRPFIEIKCDGKYNERLRSIRENYTVLTTEYYDLDNNRQTKKTNDGYARFFIKITNDPNSLKRTTNTVQRTINTSLKAIISETNEVVDFRVNTICKKCHVVLPRQSMSLFSFNVPQSNGGGACSCCSGTGRVYSFNADNFIKPSVPMKSGGIPTITPTGIQYTTVTEKFLDAIAKEYEFSWEMQFENLSSVIQNILLNGTSKEINYTDRRGSNAGRKVEKFKGFRNYTLDCYRAGRGTSKLKAFIEEENCPKCGGNRLDIITNCVTYQNISLSHLLSLSLKELRETIFDWLARSGLNAREEQILRRIAFSIDLYENIGCDYLELNRQSSTLSGGELQRLRLCTFFSSKITRACILLDEPSTGLHEQDIVNLVNLVHTLKKLGHTVIVIEHNRQILGACDHIIELGPGGGNNGGAIVFSGSISEVRKLASVEENYDSRGSNAYSSISLMYANNKSPYQKKKDNMPNKIINIQDFSAIYIHNQSVSFPINSMISICGVSGSGKSTFVRCCLIPYILKHAKELGIKKVDNLSQKNVARTTASNVGSILGINDKIAQLFAKSAEVNSRYNKSCFMINSVEGKCPICEGTGFVQVEENIYDTCPSCGGKMFSDEVLSIEYHKKNIYDFLNTSIDELQTFIDDKALQALFDCCGKIGVGYLSLIRTSKTLSKGELQRIKLASVLNSSQSGNFYVLDEPSKGLHPTDIQRLLQIIQEITHKGNTVVAVEHNVDFIRSSDHVIEFGPSSGKNGGCVVYSGTVNDLEAADTATARALLKSSEIRIIEGKEYNSDARKLLAIPGIDGELKEHAINLVRIRDDVLENLFNYTNKNYLEAIMPASSFLFGSSEDRDEVFSNTILPIIRPVGFGTTSFGRKARIVDAINLNSKISILFCSQLFSDMKCKSIFLEIFSPGSPVGKCSVCKGTGYVEKINFDLLFNKGELHPSIEKLLKARTNYTFAKKHLKKDYRLDIFKPLSQLSPDEKMVLFFGDRTKKFHEKNKDYYWEGLNRLITKEINYLDDPILIEAIKNSRRREMCSICKGSLLNPKYKEATLKAPIQYADLLKKNIGEVYNLLKGQDIDSGLLSSLKILINFGFSKRALFTPMSELSEIDQAYIQLVSYIIHPMQDSIIAISSKVKIFDTMLDDIAKSTEHSTVIVNSAMI